LTELQELYSILTSDLAVGIMAVGLVIAIGLAYYVATRVEEN